MHGQCLLEDSIVVVTTLPISRYANKGRKILIRQEFISRNFRC